MTVCENDTHGGRFLIVDHEEQAIELDMKLIESLDNRYILRPVKGSYEDGILQYNVSGCENIKNYLINRRMDRTELVGFLAQLKSVIRALEDHMLTDANILFDPKYVYIDRATRKVRFVPVCGQDGEFGLRLRPLIEELFRHADMEDTESLRFAAGMMKIVLENDLKMHTLMELAANTVPVVRPDLRNEVKRESETDSRQETGNTDQEEVTVLLSDLKEPKTGSFLTESPLKESPMEEPPSRKAKGFFSGLASRLRDDDDDDDE